MKHSKTWEDILNEAGKTGKFTKDDKNILELEPFGPLSLRTELQDIVPSKDNISWDVLCRLKLFTSHVKDDNVKQAKIRYEELQNMTPLICRTLKEEVIFVRDKKHYKKSLQEMVEQRDREQKHQEHKDRLRKLDESNSLLPST